MLDSCLMDVVPFSSSRLVCGGGGEGGCVSFFPSRSKGVWLDMEHSFLVTPGLSFFSHFY